MEKLFLDAELREKIGRVESKQLRSRGLIPAVIYSRGKEATALKISRGDLLHLLHEHRLEGVMIYLRIKDDKAMGPKPCLIKEIQRDPVYENVIHVDFNEVSLTEKIKVNVPVEAVGEPVGVKQDGGSLEHMLWELEIECLPTDIPEKIEVDVSQLKMDEAIHVKDMTFSSNIHVLTDPESVVVSVAAPMKEEEPAEAVEGEGAQEPEVIKEKKPTAEEEAPVEEKKGRDKEEKSRE